MRRWESASTNLARCKIKCQSKGQFVSSLNVKLLKSQIYLSILRLQPKLTVQLCQTHALINHRRKKILNKNSCDPRNKPRLGWRGHKKIKRVIKLGRLEEKKVTRTNLQTNFYFAFPSIIYKFTLLNL